MDDDGIQADLPPTEIDIQAMVQKYHRLLYAFAYRLTGSAADAEDLVQQAFLALQEKSQQIRDPASVRGWLFTVVRNDFLKDCRRKAPQLAENLEFDLSQVPVRAGGEPWFDGEQLQAAIDALPPQYRVVVLMFYFEDCPYKDIADKLGMPIGTVMSRLSRAKARLRASLPSPSESETAST